MLRTEIRNAINERLLNQVDIIHLPEITKEKSKSKPQKQTDLSKPPNKKKDIINMRPYVKGGSGMKKGRGFSRQEIIEASVTLNDIRCLHIPFDKRRKSTYLENIEILKSLTGDD